MNARKSGWVWLVLFGLLAGCATSTQQTKPVNPRVAAAKEANAQVEQLVEDGKYQKAFEQAKVVVEQVETNLGADHPELAEALTNLASTLFYLGKAAEALPLMEQALAVRKKAFGPEHELVAESLHNLGATFLISGDRAKAKALYEQSLDMRKRLLGPEDEAVGDSLIELGLLVHQEGDNSKAIPMYEKAIAIWKKTLGPEDKKVGMGLFSLGVIRERAGENEEALKLYGRALKIREKSLPATHPELIQSVNQLAQLRWKVQDFQGARPLFLRLLEIQEKLVGPNDPALAQSLDRTGYMLSFMGDSPAAEKLHRRAVEIHTKANGPNHKTVADSLHGLGGALLGVGSFSEARATFETCLSIYRTATGERSTEFGYGLFSLGRIEAAIGEHDKALAYYQEAVPLLEKGLGPEHQEFALVLSSVAESQMALGRYLDARESLRKAWVIQSRLFGASHPYLASTMANRGNVYAALGELDRAVVWLQGALQIALQAFGENNLQVAKYAIALGNLALVKNEDEAAIELYQHALKVYREFLGPDSFAVATTAHNLAHALAESSRFENALKLYDSVMAPFQKTLGEEHPWVAQARCARSIVQTYAGRPEKNLLGCRSGLKVLERTLGPSHPHFAQNLHCLVIGAWAQGDMGEAREAALRSLDIAEKNIDPLLDMTSEREKINLIGHRRDYLWYFLSMADRAGDALSAYERILRWKGVVANSLAAQRARSIIEAQPRLKELYSKLTHVRRHLAELMFSPVSQKGLERFETIAELTKTKESLERQLSKVSSTHRRQSSFLDAGVKKVCRKLGRDEALVDFIGYGHFIPPKPPKPSRGTFEHRLVAFVLTRASCERPVWIDLSSDGKVESAVEHYRKLVSDGAGASRVRRQARRLYGMLWAPLENSLEGVRRVWLVPDGGLNSLPFSALVDEDDRFLIERFSLSYLASALDLLERTGRRPKVKGALLAGGIDFGGRSVEATAEADSPKLRFRSAGLFPVAALPQTEPEVEDLSRRLRRRVSGSVVLLTGKEATETRVTREMAKKRFVHVATHGFFATGPLIAKSRRENKEGSSSSKSGTSQEDQKGGGPEGEEDWCEKCIGISEPEALYQIMATMNPMVLSGILLAGANDVQSSDQGDDGILTAAEMAGLDLEGTELVTLSACDTGLGEVLIGEGVMGMRRAFALAGVEALLMSLWKVPDKDTRLLMEAFYKRILRKRKVDKAEALRQAQLEMIERLRKETGYADPRSWAAFIISGR